MPIDLVSFDLDGTLVDTAGEIAEAANRTLASFGIAPRPFAQVSGLIGAGARELMRRLLVQCSAELPQSIPALSLDPVMERFDGFYAATLGSLAQPYPGCHETLTRLKSAGVRLACVTNKEIRHTSAVLSAARLGGYFDLCISGDSLAQKKPHGAVLRHVLATLRVDAAHAAHLGDSVTDVQAARNAGIGAWAVTYGYNAGQPIADAAPDRIFDTLPQVADHVLSQRG